MASVLVLVLRPGMFSGTPTAATTPQVNVYVVNIKDSIDDFNPGDGSCDTGSWLDDYCSLRAAIQEANADGVPSEIRFAQRFTSIDHIDGCSLPALTADLTTIDASDRWDTTYNRPGVEIVGLACDQLTIQSDGNVVRGLLFGGSSNVGVHIENGNSNVIGGTGPHQRNVFISGRGVEVQSTSTSNVITGNYFGTINGESRVGGIDGVVLQLGPSDNLVEKNVIGGHDQRGILIWESDGNTVRENVIGASWNRAQPISNTWGIYVQDADHNEIGPSNLIAAAGEDGVHLRRAASSIVSDNTVGYCSGSGLGNGTHGVNLFLADGSQVLRNSIGCNGSDGVHVDFGENLTIQRNGIGGNGQDGVHIHDAHNVQLGGAGSMKGNEIGGNGAHGAHLTGANAYGITVAGNYIGLGLGAFDAGNGGHGVLVDGGGYYNTIGGGGAGEGNWIGWNDQSGIMLSGSATQNNTVVGNVIGASINWGWDAPNGHHGIGIYDGSHNNFVGIALIGNIVLASGWSGIAIVNSHENLIWFNRVGTDGADVRWGNNYYGIAIVGSASNVLFANEIAYNGVYTATAGVQVTGAGALFDQISLNSIHDNNGPGIELADGGNMGLGAPTITQASCAGPIAGTACYNCTVEIYSDSADEGRVYEGSTTADGTTGVFSWIGTVNGPNVTAISIHPAYHTSPFAFPVNVGLCNGAPTAVFTYSPSAGNACTPFKFDASASTDPEDAAATLQVRWDWDNNGYYDTEWNTTKTAVHWMGSAGIHTVRLQVLDSAGLTDAATQVISLSGAPCVFLPLTAAGS